MFRLHLYNSLPAVCTWAIGLVLNVWQHHTPSYHRTFAQAVMSIFFFFFCTLLDSDACRSWPQRLSQVRSSCFTHKWYCVSFFVYIPLAKAAHMAKPDATGSGKTGPWKPINHPQGKVGKITVYPQGPARARLNVRSVNGSNENKCKRKWNGEEEEDNLHS